MDRFYQTVCTLYIFFHPKWNKPNTSHVREFVNFPPVCFPFPSLLFSPFDSPTFSPFPLSTLCSRAFGGESHPVAGKNDKNWRKWRKGEGGAIKRNVADHMHRWTPLSGESCSAIIAVSPKLTRLNGRHVISN